MMQAQPQNGMSLMIGVSLMLASRPAGPEVKTAPTMTSRMRQKITVKAMT